MNRNVDSRSQRFAIHFLQQMMGDCIVLPLSVNVRSRVATAMEEEATVRGAAKRFEVSVACAVRIGQRQRAGHGQVPGKIARHRCPLLAGEAGGWLLARLVDVSYPPKIGQ